MAAKIYSIKESGYFAGGFKVKCNGETIGQLPTLDQAIKQCQSLVEGDTEAIEFTNAQGEKKILNLFED